MNTGIAFGLGLTVPLIGIFGLDPTLALALIFLGINLPVLISQSWFWALPFLGVAGAWTLAEVIHVFDPELFQLVLAGADGPGRGGLGHLIETLKAAAPNYFFTGRVLYQLVVLCCMYVLLRNRSDLRLRFGQGLTIGIIVAGVICFAQLVGFFPDFFPKYTYYWRGLGRIPGTFSDPNAFGIFAALTLPFLLEKREESSGYWRTVWSITVLLWLVLGCFSGSRSFFVVLGVYFLYWGWSHGRSIAIGTFSVIAILTLASNLISGELLASLPIGLKRLVETLSYETALQSFFSRFTFWHIALAMWLDNLLLGVGFNQFRMRLPEYKEALEINIGLWTDNANSFYFGVLAEMGLIGLFALLFLFYKLRWHDSRRLRRAPILALLVVLVFGPHFSFLEISLLSAFLMSQCLKVDGRRINKTLGLIAWIVFLGVVTIKFSSFEYGLYPWERDGHRLYRWSSRKAQIKVPCESGRASLRLQATNPDIGENRLSVRISVSGNEQVSDVEFDNFEHRLIDFKCAQDLIVRMESDKVWMPQKYGLGDDRRALAVRVYE